MADPVNYTDPTGYFLTPGRLAVGALIVSSILLILHMITGNKRLLAMSFGFFFVFLIAGLYTMTQPPPHSVLPGGTEPTRCRLNDSFT
jgi:hypothetical protein